MAVNAAIAYHEKTGTFHLWNGNISYIMSVLENGQMGHLYFGRRLMDREDFARLQREKTTGHTSYVYESDYLLSLDIVRQEYPSYGTTDYREGAFAIAQPDGSRITDFVFSGYEIRDGKSAPEGLPGTWTGEENASYGGAKTLIITLCDHKLHARILLFYTVFDAVNVIARHAEIYNDSEDDLVLERAMSFSVDLPDDNFEMLQLDGAWAREMHISRRPLTHGIQAVSSTRGSSSAEHNPFIALLRPDTNEDQGEAYGFLLLYSGNHIAQAEVGRFGVTRITQGINPFGFSWKLCPGGQFVTPEALAGYSCRGLGDLSRTFHRTCNRYLVRGQWRMRSRPVLVNSWESAYFDFDEASILSMAAKAHQLGAELFVVDDGWFGKREDDRRSLGDWVSNRRKFPDGIEALSEKVNALGIMFGLWIEPEMVNMDSDLYRAHPDWVVGAPGRRRSPGRNQYVLDFANPEVVEHLYTQLEKLLSRCTVSYIKWDMNRPVTEPWSKSLDPDRQGEFFHRYILGVYRLYEKLTARFPQILFESCASGGARFDAGMLYYAPQAWLSDDTDASERQKIQYGASIAYPLSSIGAHVSAVPGHQTGRMVPLKTRGDTAFFGQLGYELDLRKLTEEEQAQIQEQIRFWKAHRELFAFGDFYRLMNPQEGNFTAWMVVSGDRKKAILGISKRLAQPNPPQLCVRLAGLSADACYEVKGGVSGIYYGDELMYAGLYPLQGYAGTSPRNALAGRVDSGEDKGDFTSQLYLIEEK